MGKEESNTTRGQQRLEEASKGRKIDKKLSVGNVLINNTKEMIERRIQ